MSGVLRVTFDILYRQSFDGNLPRWRTLIDLDSGPEINPGTWTENPLFYRT